MKLLFDFFPVICFFVVYKIYGIYTATLIMIAASTLQIGGFFLKYRRFEITHLLTFAIILVLGGATIITKNPTFIKWKPSVISFLMALIFMFSQLICGKSFLQYMLEKKVTLAKSIWNRLNLSWILFFVALGSINLYVAYHFSTNTWVNFKLFGVLGATIMFSILQSFYISKHIDK